MGPDLEDLLEPIFHVLCLFARRLQGKLSQDELEKARGLLSPLVSPATDPRRFGRREVKGRVHLVPANGPIVIGTLCDIGAGGMQIAARRLPAAGVRAIAHIVHPRAASRYSFPVVVVWSGGGVDMRAGLRFCGRPARRDGTRTVRLPRALSEEPTRSLRPASAQRATGTR